MYAGHLFGCAKLEAMLSRDKFDPVLDHSFFPVGFVLEVDRKGRSIHKK